MKVSGTSLARHEFPMGKYIFFILLVHALCIFSGCSIIEVRKQSQLIGKASIIQGNVKRPTGQKGTIVVLLFKNETDVYALKNLTQASAQGKYRFWATPGTYYIAAFIDPNNDGIYQQEEAWNYYGRPTGVTLAEDQTVTLDNLTITDESPAVPSTVKIENHLAPAIVNIGKVVKLDDKTFTSDNYSMGMWRPLDFLDKVGGGLFCLQEYENGKIPIVFVHGINGGPTDFGYLIEHIDRTRFQPWILYYPSGVMLDIISDHLVSAVITMQNRYNFDKLAIVGHSMGGLVTQSFVKKYAEQYPERVNNLISVITINSPLAGMPSAAYGANAPIMVQSWRDVAPDSKFLKSINNWTWPANIPYYLIFSYDGEDGDGVVPLQQQLPLKQQLDAVRIYGFHDSHVGTLQNPSFLQIFTSILKHNSE